MTAPTFEEILANLKAGQEAGAAPDELIMALTEGLKLQVADVLSILKLPHAVAAELDLVFQKVRDNIEPITEAIGVQEEDDD